MLHVIASGQPCKDGHTLNPSGFRAHKGKPAVLLVHGLTERGKRPIGECVDLFTHNERVYAVTRLTTAPVPYAWSVGWLPVPRHATGKIDAWDLYEYSAALSPVDPTAITQQVGLAA